LVYHYTNYAKGFSMSQRNSLIVFCFASALMGGIVATQSAGRDRASAQISTGAVDGVAALSPCRQCVWDYRFVPEVGATTQIAPPGSIGILHCVSGTPYASLTLYDGTIAPQNRLAVHYSESNTTSQCLDIRFHNGLIADCQQAYGGPQFGWTVTYMIEVPPSTAPEK
jgi:hypothetical protein